MKQWRRTAAGLMACAMLMGCMTALPDMPENFGIMASAEEAEYTEGTYGVLTYRNYGDHIEISGCDESVTEVEIPEEIEGVQVTWILEETFLNCTALESLDVPESLVQFLLEWGVPGTALAYSGDTLVRFLWNPGTVTEVKIREGTKCIGGAAFTERGITSVEIPDSVQSIGGSAFSYCYSLQSIEIPDGVTTIEGYTFYSCFDLKSIVIPKSVTSIGSAAFFQCGGAYDDTIDEWVSHLDVYYCGTEEEWNAIEITRDAAGYDNRELDAATIHFNYTPAPTITPADLDGNTAINASDAAILLTAAAAAGTGAETGLTDAQIAAADLNADSAFDAKDAALILQYAAYTGTGGTDSIQDFLANLN